MTKRQRMARWLPILLATAFLPLAGDATNNIQCCNLAASFANSLFGGGTGDEDFLLARSSPNVMILLSNSTSMLDFPNPLPLPGQPNSTASWGNKADNWTALDSLAVQALQQRFPTNTPAYPPTTTSTYLAQDPYDNGFASTTSLVTDRPSWGKLSGCQGTLGSCLFNPTSFYYYPTEKAPNGTYYQNYYVGSTTLGLGDPTISWSTASAKEYTDPSQICTEPTTGHSATPGHVKDATNCRCALAGGSGCSTPLKGYYLFQDQMVSGSPPAAIFAGWFLNLYPPKYIMARKVAKDIARIDTSSPSALDGSRMGLSVLFAGKTNGRPGNSIGMTDGGELVVPLGPDCTYPPRPGDFTTPRQAIIDAINSPTLVPFNIATNQLGEALYTIGQYFSNVPDASNPYATLFTAPWIDDRSTPSWLQTSAGLVGSTVATWAPQPAPNPPTQRSFCWGCQQSSVVIVSDGLPVNDNNLPQGGNTAAHPDLVASGLGDFRSWGNVSGSAPTNAKIYCPGCGVDGGNGVPNLLHKVAAFLNQTDLRSDLSGMQNVQTYTIGLGVAHANATTLLQKTADLGGGRYFAGASASDLAQAIASAAIEVAVGRTGFSSSDSAAVQTSQNTQLFLARFKPTSSPIWEGHLFRYQIWNEFAEGCDSSKPTTQQTPALCKTSTGGSTSLNPDLNGDGACSSVFVLDGDCDPVLEDSTGAFMKATFNGSHVLVAGTSPATPIWDAGQNLSNPGAGSSYRSADEDASAGTRRVIYTLLDSNSDGQFTAADMPAGGRMLELTAANVDLIQPYLQIDVATCTKIFQKMGVNGITTTVNGTAVTYDLVTATNQANALRECAKQIIWFIRGWDVLDEDNDGCGGPEYPANTASCPSSYKGEERDRSRDSRASDKQTFWKLGDIFHSSPVLVNPPAPELICDLGLDNQCVATLHSPQALSTGAVQTPIAQYTVGSGSVDAYEKYRQDNATRGRVVLVGGNDGMLHAFDAGTANTSATPDALGTYPYSNGTGSELWAFVPPDLLPKLKNALLSHDYFVDGNVMVRDVWVDGTGGSARDGTKQSGEFHTIAVLSERAGGTEYVALDVTNPTAPSFRWMFPQPCSIDVGMMGQSWSGFAPRPPPIGPVKLALDGAPDPTSRGFQERWVVMVNGGYDPTLTKGRGIWMMDAWTGDQIWRFTNDEFVDHVNSSGGMWPVPGGVSLLDIGSGTTGMIQSDGFFDTATWADIGGQVYVARFDTTDISRWAGARAFEEQRQANDSQLISNRSEFYFMPSNTVDPATGFLHTYVGSGNREKLFASGASCTPDNIFGCFQAGCNTDVTTTYNYGSCSYQVKAHANNGVIRQDRSTTASSACGSTVACNSIDIRMQVQITSCGSGGKPPNPDFQSSLTCDANGVCSSVQKQMKGNSVPNSYLSAASTRNRFYGVWSYGGASRVFNDWTTAQAFDQNRLTDIAYAGTCAGTSGRSCTVVDVTSSSVSSTGAVTGNAAGSYDAGWMYEYGHASACQLVGGCGGSDWTDEKTGSGSTILAGCVDWNTFRPGGAATSPCELGNPKSYTYLSDYITGVPSTTCGSASGSAILRATSRPAIAPPLGPLQMVTRSASGQISYSVAQIEPGNPPQSKQVGTIDEMTKPVYWLEVPRALHACRHDPTKGAACQ